jgi:cytidylate kinase
MKDQIIVAIGREHGSGGHTIADAMAHALNIPLYDRRLVVETIQSSGYSESVVDKMDEKPINFFTSRKIGDYSNSLEENVAQKTFDYLRGLAKAGTSFVVVGRCAEYILHDNPNLIGIFICGDREDKVRRIMETAQLDEAAARDEIHRIDHKRKSYHNYYCDTKWGDSRGYDVTINSSRLGISGTTDALVAIVRAFMAK